jgi:hypothetical protein
MANTQHEALFGQPISTVGIPDSAILVFLRDPDNDGKFQKEYQGEDWFLRPLGGRVFLFVSKYSDLEAASFVGRLLDLRDKFDLIALHRPETYQRMEGKK